jgi:hypothetical protein
VDESLVIIEDVLDDEEEEEDVARSGRPSPSYLSAHAPHSSPPIG